MDVSMDISMDISMDDRCVCVMVGRMACTETLMITLYLSIHRLVVSASMKIDKPSKKY